MKHLLLSKTCSSQDEYTGSSSLNQIVRTLPAGIKRAQVEDINTLHLSKDFETLKTGSLLEIGGHGTRLSTLGEKVGLGSDLCSAKEVVSLQIISILASSPSNRLYPQSPPSTSNGTPPDFPGVFAYGRKA